MCRKESTTRRWKKELEGTGARKKWVTIMNRDRYNYVQYNIYYIICFESIYKPDGIGHGKSFHREGLDGTSLVPRNEQNNYKDRETQPRLIKL